MWTKFDRNCKLSKFSSNCRRCCRIRRATHQWIAANGCRESQHETTPRTCPHVTDDFRGDKWLSWRANSTRIFSLCAAAGKWFQFQFCFLFLNLFGLKLLLLGMRHRLTEMTSVCKNKLKWYSATVDEIKQIAWSQVGAGINSPPSSSAAARRTRKLFLVSKNREKIATK